MKSILSSAMDAVDSLKSESHVRKSSYGAVREMRAVTTRCRFQCDVAEVWSVPSAATLVDHLSSASCLSGRCDLE